MFDNDNIYINSLNEDYFDDIEITDKDIESNNEIFTDPDEVGITNKYTFDIEFTGIPIDVRRSGFNAYASMLKQINDKFNRLIPYLEYTTSDKLVFCLNDWAWNKNQYYAMRVIGDVAKPEMNDVNGVIIYNDSRFFDKTDEIINVKRFNIKWGVNYIDINENRFPNVIIDLYKCMMRVCKSIYPTLSVWSITMCGVDDYSLKHKVNINKKTINDLINRINNNAAHNALKKLYRVIYGKTIPRHFYNDYFNKSKYSQLALCLMNVLKVNNINDVYIDEDNNALRVTIPKGHHLNINYYNFYEKISQLRNNFNKCIKIFIEGKLTIDFDKIYKIDQNKVNNILDIFGYNIEELVVKLCPSEKEITVDLSMFNINNLKIFLRPWTKWQKKQNYKYMKVILNKQFKPKTYKLIDHSDQEKEW